MFTFLQKFIKDPYTTSLAGFSKVTNFLKDVLLQPDAQIPRVREDVADILSEDIPGMEISNQDEPGYELITKVNLTLLNWWIECLSFSLKR